MRDSTLIPGALALVLALPSHAEQTAPTLAPIVVSATGFAQPIDDVLASVSLIDRDAIAASGVHDVPTLLATLADVQLTSNGGMGQSGNVFVRGFGGPDVLVLLDGVPLNAQDSTGVAYLNNLDADQIERIEVVRGDVSAIYGSGAVGGVVLITSRKAGATPRASAGLQIGSRHTFTTTANASTTVGSTRVQAGIARDTTAGFSAANPAQFPLANPNDNGVRSTTGSASIEHDLAPGQTIGLRAYAGRGQASYDSTAYATPTDTNQSTTTQELYQLYADNRIDAGWSSHLQLSQQTTSNTIDNFSAYPFSSNFRTRVQQLLWKNVVKIGAGWTATGGVDLQHQSIASATGDIASTTRDVGAGFVGIEGALGPNQLQVNVRDDSIQGGGTHPTGYLGYGRELGHGFKAVASWSSAFNAPPLGYLYAPYYGNAQLRPEQAHSVEGGLQWSEGTDRVRATVFQTRATDQWLYDTATSTFENIASSRTRGLELSAHARRLDWRIDANLTLQQPVNLALAGNPTLQRQARTLGNLDLSRVIGRVRVGALIHYTGPRWDQSPAGPVTLGSYATVGLTAGGALNAHWDWNARVQNLLDKQYQTVWGYNPEPFGVFVGVTWHPASS